jgi:hypothetical protein
VNGIIHRDESTVLFILRRLFLPASRLFAFMVRWERSDPRTTRQKAPQHEGKKPDPAAGLLQGTATGAFSLHSGGAAHESLAHVRLSF